MSKVIFDYKGEYTTVSCKENEKMEEMTLVGNLCTAADVIAEDIILPHLESGDCVVITNAGSYAAALTPMQFSSQEMPVEFFLAKDGELFRSSPALSSTDLSSCGTISQPFGLSGAEK